MYKIKQIDYPKIIITVIITILLLPISIRLAKAGSLLTSWWFYLLVLPIMLIGFYKRKSLSHLVGVGFRALLISVIIIGSYEWVHVISGNISRPPIWDFQVFWLNGRVASQNLAFYNSTSFYSVAEENLKLDQKFAEEVLEPAFLYPPPSMFIFNPLGWFDIRAAIELWYIVQIIFMLLSVIIAWKMFAKQEGIDGLLIITILVVIFPASLRVIHLAQLNFMMLLMALLTLNNRDQPKAGFWLALGIIIKPIMAIVLLYFVVKKQWKTIIVSVISLFTLSVLAILIYGLGNFVPYFTNNPTNKYPSWVYFEGGNQSLFSTIIRHTNFTFSTGSPLLQPPFFVPAVIILTLSTAIFVYYAKEKQTHVTSFIMTLLLALIIYPNSEITYTVLLLILIFMLWAKQTILPFWVSSGIITLIYYCSWAFNDQAFFVTLLCWLLCAILIAKQISLKKITMLASNQIV